MNPYFSIIIPTYNRAHLISKAIDSVIAQTFENWELIIVDDGSTDNTKEVISKFSSSDKRIKYFYQENQERSVARNNGIEKATGKYICFLDSDDYYMKTRLQRLHEFIINEPTERSFYYTAITYDYDGRLEERLERKRTNENVFDFIVQAIIGTPQVIIKKELLKLETFNPKWRIGEDMELWLRLCKLEEPVFIENEATVVAKEHIDRSVNVKKTNAGQEQLELYKYIFSDAHSGKLISENVKKNALSNCYFSIFKYWFYNQKRMKSLYFILKSIIAKPNSKQTRFKINVLLKLSAGKSFSKIEQQLFS
jgi:glycosyltransferase involved in cell wall biosynthesis